MHLKELVDPSFLVVARGVVLMRVGLSLAHFLVANDFVPQCVADMIEQKIQEFLSVVLEYVVKCVVLFLEHVDKLSGLDRLSFLLGG